MPRLAVPPMPARTLSTPADRKQPGSTFVLRGERLPRGSRVVRQPTLITMPRRK